MLYFWNVFLYKFYSYIEFYINKILININRFNIVVFKLRECNLFNLIVVIFFKKEFKSLGVFGFYIRGRGCEIWNLWFWLGEK